MNKKGFSLSELLVVTLIISVVAAASTPFINPKKQKKEVTKAPHGIFECYYKDGQLYEYMADNKTLTSRRPVLVTGRNYCEFVAPEANYFRFQLIGAGGNGYKKAVETSNTQQSVDGGSISLADVRYLNYGSSIYRKYAPDWVVNLFKRNPVYLRVSASSPIGSSGGTFCARRFDSSKCPNDSCLNDHEKGCPSECFKNTEHRGGSSGNGYTYSGSVPISPGNSISYSASESSTVFTAGIYSLSLGRSGNGTDGTENRNGSNGYNSTASASYLFSKTGEISGVSAPLCTTYGSGNLASNSGSRGSISVNPSSISYSRIEPALSLELGENGKPGKIENYTFPYLGGKKFKIKPAKNSKEETEVSFGTTRVISAQSGEDAPTEKPDGIRDTRQVVSTIGKHPVDYKPQNVNDNSRLLKLVSNNDTNLKSMIDKEKIKPGDGGYGSYPYLTTFSGLRKYLELAGTTYYDSTMTIKPTATTGKCINGSTKKGSSNVYKQYCEGTDGNSGAVRIVW